MRKHVFTTDTRPSPLTTTYWISLRSFFFCMSKGTSIANLMPNFIGSVLKYNLYFKNSWRVLYDSYSHRDSKYFLIKKFQTVKSIWFLGWFFTTRIRLSLNDWTWTLYFDFVHISNQKFLRLFIFVSQIPSFEFPFKRRGSSAATPFLFFVLSVLCTAFRSLIWHFSALICLFFFDFLDIFIAKLLKEYRFSRPDHFFLRIDVFRNYSIFNSLQYLESPDMSGKKGFIDVLKYSLQQDHFDSPRRMTDVYPTEPFILFIFFTISQKKESILVTSCFFLNVLTRMSRS